MFKRDNAEIDMLLTGLLILSALIGGLHHWSLGAEQKTNTGKAASAVNQPKKDTQSKNIDENPLSDASVDEIFSDIQPLVISNSVEKTIKMLGGIPIKTVIDVLEKILDIQEQNFDRDDRIELLVGIAAQYKKPAEQYAILDLIINPKYLYLRKGTPILALAARGDFPKVMPTIKTWFADRVAKQPNHAKLYRELEERALAYAVENSKLDELKAMVTHGIKMNKQRMNELLVDAVKRKTGCTIIEFLLQQGADINSVVNGYTPLIWTIKNNDLKGTKFLVDHGADVNKVGNNAIGNPRQVASEAVENASKETKKWNKKHDIEAKNNAVAIEAYLIEHGSDN
jgi:hypothetical protein